MKALIKYFLLKIGYKISREIKPSIISIPEPSTTPYTVAEFEFDMITPSIKYSPWLSDSKFMNIYSNIVDHTLVDMYRCYELWQIVELVHKLNKSASFLEVGVWRGGTSAIIAKKLNLLNATSKFYIADTFFGVVKASDKDASYSGGEHADTSKEIVQSLLADKYNNIEILEGIFPNDTSKFIPKDDMFAFCHIDVDVYESAKDIIDWIWEKLIVGGTVVFDDYGYSTCTGITRYVNEQKEMTDRIILYNLNGHAIMVKIR